MISICVFFFHIFSIDLKIETFSNLWYFLRDGFTPWRRDNRLMPLSYILENYSCMSYLHRSLFRLWLRLSARIEPLKKSIPPDNDQHESSWCKRELKESQSGNYTILIFLSLERTIYNIEKIVMRRFFFRKYNSLKCIDKF